MMLKRPRLLRLSWTLAEKLPFLILVAESKGFSVASRFSLSIRPCPTSLVLFHLSTHAIQFFSLSCISDQHTIPTFRKRDSIFMHVSALPCVFFACSFLPQPFVEIRRYDSLLLRSNIHKSRDNKCIECPIECPIV